VSKLHRMHVVEQDVFSCFICHGWGWGCAAFSLQSWGYLLSLTLF